MISATRSPPRRWRPPTGTGAIPSAPCHCWRPGSGTLTWQTRTGTSAPLRSSSRGRLRRRAMNTLAAALQQYFTSYARAQRDLSPNTIAAYRDTWRMLITHLAGTLGVPASRIDFQALEAGRVAAFLDHLEQERGNSASTRNARLTAIRAVLS